MSTGMFQKGSYFPRRISVGLRCAVGQFKGNSGFQIGNTAIMVACRGGAVPPAHEYDAWLATKLSHDPRSQPKVTGTKLRRSVIMIRGGSSITDAEKAVGLSIRRWLKALPPELAP